MADLRSTITLTSWLRTARRTSLATVAPPRTESRQRSRPQLRTTTPPCTDGALRLNLRFALASQHLLRNPVSGWPTYLPSANSPPRSLWNRARHPPRRSGATTHPALILSYPFPHSPAVQRRQTEPLPLQQSPSSSSTTIATRQAPPPLTSSPSQCHTFAPCPPLFPLHRLLHPSDSHPKPTKTLVADIFVSRRMLPPPIGHRSSPISSPIPHMPHHVRPLPRAPSRHPVTSRPLLVWCLLVVGLLGYVGSCLVGVYLIFVGLELRSWECGCWVFAVMVMLWFLVALLFGIMER